MSHPSVPGAASALYELTIHFEGRRHIRHLHTLHTFPSTEGGGNGIGAHKHTHTS